MTHTYQIINPDGTGGELFEVEQPAAAPPLLTHPLTGQPVRRVPNSFSLAGRHSERAIRATLRDTAALSRLGFARYEKDNASGRYHKTNGPASAPETLQGNNPH
ncbi:MAG: hypothetical protein LBG65_04065 [Puniceicoccales bacterium]|nr:hypothetical protein [Puniceicoccales bacterium]